MSGRAKRIMYFIVTAILFLFAIAGSISIAYFYGLHQENVFAYRFSFAVFCIITVFLPFEIFLHELGHLFFGVILGFRPVSFSVWGIVVGRGNERSRYSCRAGGKTVLLPRSEKRVSGRFLLSSVGGAAFNLIYGGVLLTCLFLLPISPALFFFALFAPFNIYEGIAELLPCELPAGRTDGKMIAEFIKKTAYAQTFLAVSIAQGQLVRDSYAKISKDLLFHTPVIREDEPAAMSLLQMRWQYAHFNGDGEEAEKQISRMEALCEDGVAPMEFVCDVAWWKRIVRGEAVSVQAFGGKTVSELRTRYALEGVGKGEALSAITREKFLGLRLFEEKLITETQEKFQ